MEKYFLHLTSIDPIFYTNHLLHSFIPNKKFDQSLSLDKPYIIYYDCTQDSVISDLSKSLVRSYNFPPISHMTIFKHTGKQSIHIDGGPSYHQHASLNLPLQNFENTKMYFYETLEEIKINSKDAHYFDDINNLKIVCELKGSNDWVLVNAGVPHNIVGSTSTKPRITACIRFIGNPRFETLVSKIKNL